MAAANVVYLPGLFGSTLGTARFFYPGDFTVWVSPLSVISGIVIQLQLAADGVSPGPATEGIPCFPTGLVDGYYEPLALYMEMQGYTVWRAAFDWRKDVNRIAEQVAADLVRKFVNDPFVFVAHSFGGLVARQVAGILQGQGRGRQVQGIITLGTPHFGSLVPVQTWFGIAAFYQRLAQGAGLFFPGGTPPRLTILDLICATWPALYTCMSFRNSGPLFSSNPAAAAAIYDADNYAGGNPFLQSASLEAAITAQASLGDGGVGSRTCCIVGSGVRTPDNLDMTRPLNSPIVYEFSDFGDGVVPADSASLPGSQVVTVQGVAHENMPQDGRCMAAVRYFLQQLTGIG